MLDIKLIRENPDKINGLLKKQIELDNSQRNLLLHISNIPNETILDFSLIF